MTRYPLRLSESTALMEIFKHVLPDSSPSVGVDTSGNVIFHLLNNPCGEDGLWADLVSLKEFLTDVYADNGYSVEGIQHLGLPSPLRHYEEGRFICGSLHVNHFQRLSRSKVRLSKYVVSLDNDCNMTVSELEEQ